MVCPELKQHKSPSESEFAVKLVPANFVTAKPKQVKKIYKQLNKKSKSIISIFAGRNSYSCIITH